MPFHPKQLLAATDFSDNARPAVDAAADLARTFGAELTLLHIIPLSSYVDFAAGVEGSSAASLEYQASIRAAVKKSSTEELARLEAAGSKPRLLVLDGAPALEIARVAGQGGYDLVVVGTHGRTGLKHVLLGSVAEGVVRHSPVAVLTVRGPR